MTTGQSLTERAAQADRESRQKMRDDAAERRGASLDKVIERWHDAYHGAGDRLGVDCPERSEFEFRSNVQIDGGRHDSVSGWAVEVDGVVLLQSTTYGNSGLHVILTTPCCGVERAEHVSSVDQLGRLLREGRGFGHHCRETETRAIAYAIGSAARDLRLSERELVEEAQERHADLIARLRFGR